VHRSIPKFKPLLLPLLLSLIIILWALPLQATNTENIQPLLVIEKVNTEEVIAGSFFYVTLIIKNHSDYPAFNILAHVSSQGEKKDIFSRTIEDDPDLEMIEGQQTRSLTFAVNTSTEAESKDYNLLINLEYQNALFETVPRSSANITVPVVFELTQPNITVNRIVLDPKTPAAQEPFTAIFYLDNHSKAEARNVTVEINGQDNFKIMDFTNRKFVKTVSRGANNFVLFKLQGLEGRKSNNVELKFTYEHTGEKESQIQVNLPLENLEAGSNPFLKVNSFSLQETPRSGEHVFQLKLENVGQEAAKNVSLSLDGGASIYILNTSNIDFIKEIEGKAIMNLEYNLGINTPKEDMTHYPLKVLLSYEDRSGNAFTSEETLGIPSFAKDELESGTPRVLISKYTLSDEKILAGNMVTLSLFIENTNIRPVHNTKVSFKVIEVEGSTGGTIFSPVNSSNSFFIEQIPGRTTLEKSIDFLVDPNAVAKTYIVPVTIEYEDENAKAYTVEELVNIPVTQECKLQVLDLELPPLANVGQPIFIGAEFVNVGKTALNNFIVMLEGEFQKEQASYYVGNLEIGASDYYQGTIHPEKEGILTGKLIFSYVDNNNKEVQVEEPFEINIQPMGEMEPFPDGFPEGHEPGGGPTAGIKKILLYVSIPAVIALAVGIYLWRRKIKKKNEEFLDA
jgi:hypothetical protein